MWAWALIGLPALAATPSLSIGKNFTGSVYGTNSPYLPADGNGAVGPRHFMEFINGTVAIYNKTNASVNAVQRKTNLKFWADAGLIISTDSTVTDPRVIYDSVSQRWFASQVDADANATDPTLEANDFLLAVSATSDPTGIWRGFSFQADPDTGYFADFPTLGVDGAGVYLSGDFYFGQDNPIGAGLVSIPKADLLSATPTVANRTWFGIMDYSERGQVLQPASCFDGSSTGAVLSLGDIGSDTINYSNLVYFAVQNAGSGTATLGPVANLNVPAYSVPYNADFNLPMFNPLQPDNTTTLTANDARISARVNAVGGVLYAAHSTEVNGRVAVRWYRVNASTHALLESGTLSDTNMDLYFPSIAANTNGTIVIACNGSGGDNNISCFATAGRTVNGVTTFGPLLVLMDGQTVYHGDDELLAELLDEPPSSRWGDYSALSVDPSDPNRFWSIQMYAAGEDIWATQITELITTANTASPVLSISLSNGVAQVSWPLAAGPFNLQSATNLAPTIFWTPITQNLSTNGPQIFYQTPATNPALFFRLKQP